MSSLGELRRNIAFSHYLLLSALQREEDTECSVSTLPVREQGETYSLLYACISSNFKNMFGWYITKIKAFFKTVNIIICINVIGARGSIDCTILCVCVYIYIYFYIYILYIYYIYIYKIPPPLTGSWPPPPPPPRATHQKIIELPLVCVCSDFVVYMTCLHTCTHIHTTLGFLQWWD